MAAEPSSAGPQSLRTRLWIAGLAGVVLAAALSAWGLGALFERANMAAFDRRLQDDQLTLIGLLARDGNADVRFQREPADARYERAFSGHYWQVRTESAVFRSRSLWDRDLDPVMAPGAGALRWTTFTGPLEQPLRAVVRTVRIAGVAAPVTVAVAADLTGLHADVRRFRTVAAAGAAGVGGLLLLLTLMQVNYGLRPLARLAEDLADVRAGNRERVDEDHLPTEVRPLAVLLNEVLVRHEAGIRRARHAAGDLAHALKTPLAVLAAAAERPDGDLPATVAAQVSRIRTAVDRHLAAGTPGPLQGRAEVAPVVQALARLLHQVHRERDVWIRSEVPAALAVRCATEDLEEMLGNLLDNACRWARSSVVVNARPVGDKVAIEVVDDGPGLAPEAMAAVLERGVRLDEREDSSGLGLSITRDLAEACGGQLALAADASGGLRVTLTLAA